MHLQEQDDKNHVTHTERIDSTCNSIIDTIREITDYRLYPNQFTCSTNRQKHTEQ